MRGTIPKEPIMMCYVIGGVDFAVQRSVLVVGFSRTPIFIHIIPKICTSVVNNPVGIPKWEMTWIAYLGLVRCANVINSTLSLLYYEIK